MPEIGKEAGAPAPEAKVPSMTLGAYLAEAGKALRTGIPQAWVDAIVLDAKSTKDGMKVELIEPSADEANDGRRADQRYGRLSGMIWARKAAEIEGVIGLPLDAATLKGAYVRMLIKTTFDPKWHLGGEVLELDPACLEMIYSVLTLPTAKRTRASWTARLRAGVPTRQRSGCRHRLHGAAPR